MPVITAGPWLPSQRLGVIRARPQAYDPSKYSMTFQNIWWASNPALGYADGDPLTNVAPYVTGPDTLAYGGGGTCYFRAASSGMNNRPVLEHVGRMASVLTAAAYGGVVVFRQRSVVSDGAIVAGGTNTRVRNSGTANYQMRYNGGTALTSSGYTPDTLPHVLAFHNNVAGNETLWLDGTKILDAASADGGTGIATWLLNYDNTTYGSMDFALACSTTGDPTASAHWPAFLAATKQFYGVA